MTKQQTKIIKQQSRRSFLKNSALIGAGIFIIPRHVLGRGFIAPSDKLVIAAVGVGGKGESDISSFFKSGNCTINYLCDVDDVRSATSRTRFPKAKYYRDWREMYDKEHKNFDAVSVSTPDHNHAVQAMAAMQLSKHVYVQKLLTHDIFEARALTDAAIKYKVVTQMGNQGASGDGVRQLMEWYDEGKIGDVSEVYCWTDRPVWPQGIPWPSAKATIPSTLNWDLWLGTATKKDYIEKLVPFNWRGWWDYGTGALGDMGCHLIEPAFRVLGLQYATDVQASVGSVYVDEFKRGYFPESAPPSSHVIITFPKSPKTSGPIKIHWMDGGIQPERPAELGANEVFGDGGNGVLFIGSKGKMMCSTYGSNPQLLPTALTSQNPTAVKYQRVLNGADGHYEQWVNAAIAGYGKKELSSPFEIAGPVTESLLMANLAIRAHDIRIPKTTGSGFTYPGRNLKLIWDNLQMKVTNLDEVNQFVKRNYREGYSL